MYSKNFVMLPCPNFPFLVDKYGFVHFSTAEFLFEDILKSNTSGIVEIKQLCDKESLFSWKQKLEVATEHISMPYYNYNFERLYIFSGKLHDILINNGIFCQELEFSFDRRLLVDDWENIFGIPEKELH